MSDEKTPEVRQGFLRRLAYTPLRDLVRGRVSGRLDLGFKMDEAALPESTRRVVVKVVRRTRLWPTEKADVGTELVTHFADGLAAGESADAMVVAFGPPARAARLIRRARRRGRPAAWRIWLRTVQVVLLLLVVVVGLYLAATVRLFTGQPHVVHDYLADLNAPAIAVPAYDRAWPVYREALMRLQLPGSLPSQWLSSGLRPGDPDWYDIAEFLQAHEAELALVRDAASRPGLGYVVGYAIAEPDRELWPDLSANDPDAGLAAVLLPQLDELRTLNQLLGLDVRRAAADGDGEVVTADLAAMLRIAEHLREVPIRIGDLVALSCTSNTLAALGDVLSRQPDLLTAGELHDLAHRVAGLGDGGPLRVRLVSEVMLFRDLMQRLYTDDGDGNGWLTAHGLDSLHYVQKEPGLRTGPMLPAFAFVVADRQDMLAQFDMLMALVQGEQLKPLWQQDYAVFDSELGRITESPIRSVRYQPVARFVPSVAGAGRRAELVTQKRDALCVAIAMELYRRDHGDWPGTLDALVPAYLPRIPLDRFDGAPLRYRSGDNPVLYSVGADRDDDGGDGTPGPPSLRDPRAAADGDWVLWAGTSNQSAAMQRYSP